VPRGKKSLNLGNKPVLPGVIQDNIVWLWEITNPNLIALLRNALAHPVHQVENFAQYLVRKMATKGYVLDFSSQILQDPEGYTLTVTFKIKGVNVNVLEEHLNTLKLYEKAKSRVLWQYRIADRMTQIPSIESGEVEGVDVELRTPEGGDTPNSG